MISLILGFGGIYTSPVFALVGLYGFYLMFSGKRRPWSTLTDRFSSQNVLSQTGTGSKALVLMAHLDTAKTYYPYHPRLVKRFRSTFVFNTLLAISLLPLTVGFPELARLIGAYFLVQALVLLYREARAPTVNGANDNASGVAVATELYLDLADRLPPDWQLHLALTGCEEVGHKGASALQRDGVIPRDTAILNIDNVGRGVLHAVEGEGMIGYIPYRGKLLQAARRLERPLTQFRLAYFDTLPFARLGQECLTLIRLEDGVPANWHWTTDTVDAIDDAALADTYAYATRIIQNRWASEDYE
jgi:hypothetical protein